MRSIMVATDFSERSDRALCRAILLAKETGAELILAHAIDAEQARELLQSATEKATELLVRQSTMLKATDGVSCTHKLVYGSADASIAQASIDENVDLLVVGPHRRQLLRDLFFCPTAVGTIRAIKCPVLMTNATAVGHYRRVLLATDLSDASRDAIEAATALGLTEHAVSSLLYVFDALELRLAMSHTLASEKKEQVLLAERAEAVRQLSTFAAGLGVSGMEQLVRYDEMTPAVEILAAAEEISADLVVVGTRGRSGIARLLLGSVAEEVLRRADRDVLAVPPRAET